MSDNLATLIVLAIIMAGAACFQSAIQTLRDPSSRPLPLRCVNYGVQIMVWYIAAYALASHAMRIELSSTMFWAAFAIWTFFWLLHFYKLERGIARRAEQQVLAIAE